MDLPGPGAGPRGIVGIGLGKQPLAARAEQAGGHHFVLLGRAGCDGRSAPPWTGGGRRGEIDALQGQEALREVAEHGDAQFAAHAVRRDNFPDGDIFRCLRHNAALYGQ